MDGKQLVVLEGQQHWIDPAIAQDDTFLRQLLRSLNLRTLMKSINFYLGFKDLQ